MSQAISTELMNNESMTSMSRLVSSLFIGVFMVAILFWAMQYMIENVDKEESTNVVFKVPEYVRATAPKKEIIRTDRVKPPPPPVEPPKQPRTPTLKNVNIQTQAISISSTPVKTEVTLSNDGYTMGAISEGKYLPVVKIAPIYPAVAADRGVEGYCTVVYTVTNNGRTSDIRVDQNDCTSRLFHRASIKAASKFKYKPMVRNGEAISVSNVKNRFKFELNE